MTSLECRKHIQHSKRWRLGICIVCDIIATILIFAILAIDELPNFPALTPCFLFIGLIRDVFNVTYDQAKLFGVFSLLAACWVVQKTACLLITKHIQNLYWHVVEDGGLI